MNSFQKKKFNGSDELFGENSTERRPMVTFSSLQKNGKVAALSEEMSVDAEEGKAEAT